MNDSLLSAIKAHDFTAIRNICFALSEQERNDLIHTLQTARWEQLYHNTDKRAPRLQSLDIVCFSYIFLCVSRSSDSLKKAVKGCYSSDKDIVAEFLQFYFPPLLDLLTTKEGQYLTTSLQSLRKNQFLQDTTFQNLWTLYQKGFIAFDEDLFIEKFFFWNNKHITDEPFVNFLLENKEISEKIFSIVPQHITQEVPYPSDAWKELYHILQAKGYFADRSIVGSHIEALLNPYKKNILDFYCRIIETFEPTRQELLSHQSTFFALLSSDKTSVVNFVMKLIKEISSEKDFDFQAFADNFALCFATQKIAKSQLIGLDILAKHYKQQPPANIDYREQLAVLFTVPDAKLQEKVASLLTTYFGGEGLAEVVALYQDYLKGKAQELLSSESPDSSESTDPSYSKQSDSLPKEIACAARTPRTWDDLLFLIGDCIRERSPLALDLFFEGLCLLQAQIPTDFSKQISPYQKQLGEQPFEFTTYRKCMRWVIDVWEGKASLSNDIFGGKLYNPTPFLREKTKRLLLKLKQGNTMPFVSTPTHAPFYIDPLTFLERITQYEKTGKSPMLEDVVVGLNRLLPIEITEAQKQLALSLTGEYASALQYYFEVSKTISVTDATRVLWGQVLRLKDIDGVFPELEISQKPNLQGLVRPFYLKYEVKPTKINGVERNKIILEDNWDKKYSTYSLYNDLGGNYYNASPMSKATDEDIDYGLSLNPRYIDGWLCKYLLTYAQGVEGESLTEATRVMSLLLEHHLPIYHGGWLMVATCLLSERKNLRDLATEYILLALQKGEMLTYLAEAIGTLLAHKYAPIARFVEFLDIPTRDAKVKAFQKSVIEAYLPLAEKQEKKPTNHKKLVAFCS
ncbi:DUF6493 family protein [uncultured Capnocytophaga sp.]|uniref:DUF6493 family protein n=1 Tax=uncultured Capnocytophaga sp. TaxID=159273 RepID=UPI00261A58DA|nr:DUF6493 family protein [uncultured Capnocytophaga sp.]